MRLAQTWLIFFSKDTDLVASLANSYATIPLLVGGGGVSLRLQHDIW